MKPLLAVLVALVAARGGLAAEAANAPEKARFTAVDVYLDSASPVAAWQFEFSDRNGGTKVVGVENGEAAAFRPAPYYDREAIARGDAERVVVADYSLAEKRRLPRGRIRVATLHLMVQGDVDFALRLVTANTSDGQVIDASISLEPKQTREP